LQIFEVVNTQLCWHRSTIQHDSAKIMEAITAYKLLWYCILWRCKRDNPKRCECL